MTAKVPRFGSHNAALDATAWLSLPPEHPVFIYSVFIFSFTKEHPNWGSRCPVRTDLTEKVIYIKWPLVCPDLATCLPVSCIRHCLSMFLSFPHVPAHSPPAPPSQAREGQREKRVQNQESLTPRAMAHLCLLPSSFRDYSNSLNKYFISSYIVLYCILI